MQCAWFCGACRQQDTLRQTPVRLIMSAWGGCSNVVNSNSGGGASINNNNYSGGGGGVSIKCVSALWEAAALWETALQ